ncbi:hypothetical protein [Pedobacter sp. N23S346]|uniref:hypothetical protein n=1 Tax=Pedobacter sp. N23S346 TaxID=3402750 RepID=UPI003AC780FD
MHYLISLGRSFKRLLHPLLFIIGMLVVPMIVFSQKIEPSKWKATLNGPYATLLGSNTSVGIIGSYASLEPINGAFSFKGTIPFGDPRKSRLSFLSISAQGELIDGNFATVFKNTKLNTTAGINLEYNFRILKENPSRSLHVDGKYFIDLELTSAARRNVTKSFEQELAKAGEKILALRENIECTNEAIEIKKNRIKEFESEMSDVSKSNKERETAFTERQKIVAELPKLQKLIDQSEFQIDSLGYVKSDNYSLATDFGWKQLKIDEEKKKKLQNDYKFAGYKFLWITLIVGSGKKDYFTFESTNPFADQIQNPNLATYKLGATINFYYQDQFEKKGLMINMGFQWMRDNNLSLLSTQDITQESLFKNGDITRKVVKKYIAYTDPSKIVEYHQFGVFSNLYYIFNNGNIAAHFFPSYYKPNGGHGYVDSGAGIMFSLKDEKKEKHTLNLEAYMILSDTFNSLSTTNKSWDRNEFGVRATLPFNRLFKSSQ